MAKATIHPGAVCNPDQVGEDSSIGSGSTIGHGVLIGSGTLIGSGVTLLGPTAVAESVAIETGARVLRESVIAAGVSIGANAVVGSEVALQSPSSDSTVVDVNASIGAGAIIGRGLRIGSGSLVRPGAVVSTDVPPQAIVGGNPARIEGYANVATNSPIAVVDAVPSESVTPMGVGQCEVWQIPSFRDLRGSLVALDYGTDLPFSPERTFFVHDVPSQEVRGEHAHRVCAQFLIAVHGSLSVVIDDGRTATEVQLHRPDVALHIPPGVWGVQYRFSADAVLAVHASHAYESKDYIRDYEQFLGFAEEQARDG